MSDLLLEIGTEEIPAKFMPPALAELAKLTKEKLDEHRLAYEKIDTWGTPRRITLYVRGLAESQADLSEEVRGPAVKAAFDAEGNPTKAAMGFAKGQGVDVKDLIVKDIPNGSYVFALKKAQGIAAAEVLPEILPQLVLGIHFPKPMRWGYNETRYARPIRWIVALNDDKVIDFAIENIKSGRVSRGHRFLSTDHVEIKDAESYLETMEQNFVIVEPKRREDMIVAQIHDLAASVEGEVETDEDLLEEIVFLVEYPTALMGNFDPSYLIMPEQLIITPMKEHQRYFPVLKGHHLLPKFITVRNGGREHLETVQAGNEKVLVARLDDAKFFYTEDLKVNLHDNIPKLKTIVFQEKLGTVYEKTQRVKKGVENISDLLKVGVDVKERASLAADLCKADLLSNVVYEFPELQGIMGEKYAFAQGEHPLVAKAISEHYLPRFAGDEIPLTFEGLILSIADKLDTICGCFAVGIEPSGSQDPYALRRQALGICTMIKNRGILVSLHALIKQAIANLPQDLITDADALEAKIYAFFEQRVRNILNDNAISFDVAEAVIAAGYDNVSETLLKAQALQEFKSNSAFEGLMTVYTRANNLAKKAENMDMREEYLTNEAEKSLFDGIIQADIEMELLESQRKYKQCFLTVAKLDEKVNQFFESVMVMDEDLNIRANRLAMLAQFTSLTKTIADLSKLV